MMFRRLCPALIDLIDFGDRVLLPGLVDTHVHINEPGRTEWEGFETATQAAAAGGVTTLVDMPLNCVPETIDVQALEAKRTAAQGQAWVDWAAWGGVVRGNAESLAAAWRAPAFRASNASSFTPALTASRGWMKPICAWRLAKLRGTGLPLLAHAEIAGPVDAATQSAERRRARTGASTRLIWRRVPTAAEVDAIALLIRLAEEFQTPIHIVHLSSAQALPLLAAARERGVPVTVETCAQYLMVCRGRDSRRRDGIQMRAADSRRGQSRETLWRRLSEGRIDMVTTDHSPCPPAMKRREEGRFDQAWGGIASLGLALPVMWTAMQQRGMKLERDRRMDGAQRLRGLRVWRDEKARSLPAPMRILQSSIPMPSGP